MNIIMELLKKYFRNKETRATSDGRKRRSWSGL